MSIQTKEIVSDIKDIYKIAGKQSRRTVRRTLIYQVARAVSELCIIISVKNALNNQDFKAGLTLIIIGCLCLYWTNKSYQGIYKSGEQVGQDIARQMFKVNAESAVLEDNYKPSVVIDTFIKKLDNVINGVIQTVLTLSSGLVSGILTIIALMLVSPAIGIGVILLGSLYYGVFAKINKKNQEMISLKRVTLAEEIAKEVISAVERRRLLIMHNLFEEKQASFAETYKKYRQAEGEGILVGIRPKYILDNAVYIGFGVYVVILGAFTDNEIRVAELGALAVGLQRLMPAIQSSFHALTAVRNYKEDMRGVCNVL